MSVQKSLVGTTGGFFWCKKNLNSLKWLQKLKKDTIKEPSEIVHTFPIILLVPIICSIGWIVIRKVGH